MQKAALSDAAFIPSGQPLATQYLISVARALCYRFTRRQPKGRTLANPLLVMAYTRCWQLPLLFLPFQIVKFVNNCKNYGVEKLSQLMFFFYSFYFLIVFL